MRLIFWFILGFVIFGFSPSLAQEPMHLPIDAKPLVITTPKGKFSYDLEIAFTSEESAAGLMYRIDFPKNRAMLFKFSNMRVIDMWMANTPLPLDMLFINEKGKIVAIAENTVPYSTDIVSSGVPAAFTIELNAGEVNDKQIKENQYVDHPAICNPCEVTQQ
ncbi:DUF192 domain-containing protein [Bartonella tamiae]|uniref:DUF192 domain-containing protein n=1 Tax=Bartonella tamiae Th239 TaxID=1094558 RepID=J1JW10_9HYPH|nr:DUF192 domain-containing protein [Bartonella tamiae]EJF88765.1 hypothetical protein ME5_01316 [Bartonella tamiae Th239]EJF94985.1 hypothetical protein MEG_00566 [Bartonella tamiae Th307]